MHQMTVLFPVMSYWETIAETIHHDKS